MLKRSLATAAVTGIILAGIMAITSSEYPRPAGPEGVEVERGLIVARSIYEDEVLLGKALALARRCRPLPTDDRELRQACDEALRSDTLEGILEFPLTDPLPGR